MAGRTHLPDLTGRTLAHYRVLSKLGHGGMGEVFLAEDQRLGRRVALKVLRPDLTAEPRHLERFRREARSIAALNHPNIVTIHAVEEVEGLHFLVLELVEGETLAEVLATKGPLPLDRVLTIAGALIDALEAAHSRGIIHRDLKPRNIMVGRDGRIKILDFGIAYLTGEVKPEADSASELTRTGGVVGTTSYMSPEQIEGRPVDQRSDLFSLGIVLYEMAAGQRPFRGSSHLTTVAAILYDTPQPPSQLVPGLPHRFDEIVSLCLAKEPFLRYRRVTELRKALLSLSDPDDTTTATTLSDEAPPQPREADSSSSNRSRGTSPRLPARPRCFGRESEVGELVEALCAESPLPIPVLGPAGAGKTTITLSALHDPRVVERFGRRRWFIRCDGATGRDSLVGAIARVICPEAAPPLEPKIFFDLQEAPAVLALDNFETPWERDTAAVEELLTELAGIPGLALVVALRGEQRPYGPSWREAIHAGPLDLDAARSAFLSVAGERFRHDPDLDLLLLSLDGLALAVVLLAGQAEGEPDLAMLRSLWQERKTAILQRTGGGERQNSLEVSLSLSIDSPRMTTHARRLLSILGLLPEGVAREDLEALLPGHGAEAASVLRKVGLVFDHGSRLRMLAPIREYVRQSMPPQEEDRDRTVDHYVHLAHLGEKIGTIHGAEAVLRLRPEVVNLEHMILAGLDRTDPVPAIRSALAYADAVRFIGTGGLTLIEQARQVAQRAFETKLEADCIRKLGDISLYRAHYEQAQVDYEHAREVYQLIQDQHGEAWCTTYLGDIELHRTQLDHAHLLHQKGSIRFRELGDQRGEAYCLLGLGGSAVQRSDYEAARAQLTEARILFQKIGDLLNEANCLLRMGQISFDLAQMDKAREEFEAALPLFRRVGSLLGEASSLKALGQVALQQGDPKDARILAGKALLLSRRVGSLLGEANCLFLLGEASCTLSDFRQAEALIQQARQHFQRMNQAVGIANCDEILGIIAAEQSDFLKAKQYFESALKLFQEAPRLVAMGHVHLKLANLSSLGSPERRSHVKAARQAWESAGVLAQMAHELEAVPIE